MPTPLVAFPWGSPSMSRTRRSATARLAARLTAVVVLPTPPFWLAIAMTRGEPAGKELVMAVEPDEELFAFPAWGKVIPEKWDRRS
jgi:hypothetical protein